MKIFFPLVQGNDALRHRIGAEFYHHSFSHAYILEGAQGSGKHTLAKQMAMAAACENRQNDKDPLPCGTCKFCRKIASGNCPDVITVSRAEGKATMSVDVVRDLRADIATVPNDLDVKVYIIEDAHTMTKQAQNAFLLTLEEPPAFVLFLLLTEDAGALLETVRSRAPIFRLQPIDDATMRNYLLTAPEAAEAHALFRESPQEFDALIALSNGSIGKALALLHPEKRAPLIKRRENAIEILSLLAAGTAQDSLLHLFHSFDERREELVSELSMLALALRDLSVLSRTETAPLIFFTDREAAAELSAQFTTAKLLAISEMIEKSLTALAANANTKLTVTHLLSQLI